MNLKNPSSNKLPNSTLLYRICHWFKHQPLPANFDQYLPVSIPSLILFTKPPRWPLIHGDRQNKLQRLATFKKKKQQASVTWAVYVVNLYDYEFRRDSLVQSNNDCNCKNKLI